MSSPDGTLTTKDFQPATKQARAVRAGCSQATGFYSRRFTCMEGRLAALIHF